MLRTSTWNLLRPRILAGPSRATAWAATRGACILMQIVTGLSAAGTGSEYIPGADLWHRNAPQVSHQTHPAIVRVMVDEGRAEAHGSGTFVGVREQFGLVVTNWHVVRAAKGKIEVVFPDGFRSNATVLRTDKEWDLAALSIWKPNVTPMTIATVTPRPGDALTIAGYGPGDFRMSTGRCTQYVSPSTNHPYEILEVSTEARQGDSGGPILNERGELAGVLFGANRGITTGSYCGRVKWFLESVWPTIGVQQQPSVFASTQLAPTATGTPAQSVGFNDSSAAIDNPSLMVPIADESQTTNRFGLGPPVSNSNPFDAGRYGIPSTANLPAIGDTTVANGQLADWIGTSRFDQVKTALAAIGILAVLSWFSKS